MVAIEEVEEGGQEEFAGDGPEAEEDAEESCECGEDGEVGEMDADEAFWEEELEGGDEDGFADADAAGHQESDGEAHGPGEAVGSGEEVPFLDGELEGAVGEDPDGEALPEEAEDVPEDDEGELSFSEGGFDGVLVEACEDFVEEGVEDFRVEESEEDGDECGGDEEPVAVFWGDASDAGGDEADEGDEDVGEHEDAEFEDLGCGGDVCGDAVGFGEVDAADDLPDDAGDVSGEFGEGPDARGGADGEGVSEGDEDSAPGGSAEEEEEE